MIGLNFHSPDACNKFVAFLLNLGYGGNRICLENIPDRSNFRINSTTHRIESFKSDPYTIGANGVTKVFNIILDIPSLERR